MIRLLLPAYIVATLTAHASPAGSWRITASVEDPPFLFSSADGTATDTAAVQPAQAELKWHSWLTNLPSDWARFGRWSFRLERVPLIGAIAGMTGLLMATDKESYRLSDRFYSGSGAASYWSSFFADLGDGRSQFGLAGAFALYGVAAGDSRSLRTGSQLLEAVLSSGAVVQLLKHITGRESPFVATRPTGTWRFFPNQIEYHKKVPHYDAFPSGHICTSIATVTVIAENYPEVWWIKPVGYVLTGLIGVGMVNEGIHWYSDYPLGLMLGYAFGMIVSHPGGDMLASPAGTSGASFGLYPAANGRSIGLVLACSF